MMGLAGDVTPYTRVGKVILPKPLQPKYCRTLLTHTLAIRVLFVGAWFILTTAR